MKTSKEERDRARRFVGSQGSASVLRPEWFGWLLDDLDRLPELAGRLLQWPPPTTIPMKEDCTACYYGTINVGSAIDPEPGPCPACACEFHREPHADCMMALAEFVREEV